jgi:hypothetical protein
MAGAGDQPQAAEAFRKDLTPTSPTLRHLQPHLHPFNNQSLAHAANHTPAAGGSHQFSTALQGPCHQNSESRTSTTGQLICGVLGNRTTGLPSLRSVHLDPPSSTITVFLGFVAPISSVHKTYEIQQRSVSTSISGQFDSRRTPSRNRNPTDKYRNRTVSNFCTHAGYKFYKFAPVAVGQMAHVNLIDPSKNYEKIGGEICNPICNPTKIHALRQAFFSSLRQPTKNDF